jgi:hypothetical protein
MILSSQPPCRQALPFSFGFVSGCSYDVRGVPILKAVMLGHTQSHNQRLKVLALLFSPNASEELETDSPKSNTINPLILFMWPLDTYWPRMIQRRSGNS